MPSPQHLGDVEARFRERGAPLQAEVSTLADPSLVAELSRRGYVLRSFENVSGRSLEASLEPGGDIEIDLATDSADDAREWIDAAITAFQHPDAQGVPADELPPRDVLEGALRPWAEAPGFRRYRARIGGELGAWPTAPGRGASSPSSRPSPARSRRRTSSGRASPSSMRARSW